MPWQIKAKKNLTCKLRQLNLYKHEYQLALLITVAEGSTFLWDGSVHYFDEDAPYFVTALCITLMRRGGRGIVLLFRKKYILLVAP
jgi:hypothetical protein